MIELPRTGYGSTPPSAFVQASEVALVSTRARHSMDDRNTTVVTLKSGVTIDTSLAPDAVRCAVEAGVSDG